MLFKLLKTAGTTRTGARNLVKKRLSQSPVSTNSELIVPYFELHALHCSQDLLINGKQTVQTSYRWKPVSSGVQSTSLLIGWIPGQAGMTRFIAFSAGSILLINVMMVYENDLQRELIQQEDLSNRYILLRDKET
jgi:hypothetical protein